MSGEYTKAAQIVEAALEDATASPSMSPEALSSAMLGILLQKQSSQQSKADILSFVQFQLDNLEEDEFVVTRGC